MTRSATTALLLLSLVAAIGCEPRPRYHERGYGDRYGYDRHDRDFDQAWDVVRRDPCRYDEYREYAADHRNPDKRRAKVWSLARNGCAREQSYGYERGYEYER